MSEANEVKEPEWWMLMLEPDGQHDLRVLGDMGSSMKDVDFAVKQIARKMVDRRTTERRKPKRGVNVRHDDRDGYKPKRIRRGEAK